ncbi:hypothetical protein EVAR_74248_1 [Eumeta japonica]|uniref:Uncharacterized protein n=1 Tax=Eumeta variegata TaxID=151549 RepID=A0A4C1SCG1_EUMVA|nr:hypothetical protein EVAR_74248_1 [Eumeta japonica]
MIRNFLTENPEIYVYNKPCEEFLKRRVQPKIWCTVDQRNGVMGESHSMQRIVYESEDEIGISFNRSFEVIIETNVATPSKRLMYPRCVNAIDWRMTHRSSSVPVVLTKILFNFHQNRETEQYTHSIFSPTSSSY